MKKLLIIGSIPPPHHGVTIYNKYLLDSELHNFFNIIHLDISDRRQLDNLGKLDFINLFLGLKNIFQLVKILFKYRPDIMYVPISQNIAFLRDGLFIILCKIFSKSKIVIHLHGNYFLNFYKESSYFLKKFINFSLKKVDTGIVLGESLIYNLDTWIDDVRVLPNGIENTYLNVAAKTRNNFITVGYLGNLLESKGIFNLVKAADIIVRKSKNTVFKIAGQWIDNKIQKVIFDFISRNNLESNVQFPGPAYGQDKNLFFQDIDIFCFPTWYKFEAHPLVLLEAMSYGCPIVSSAGIGAIPETITDNVNGLLVNPLDENEIADAILYLIENPGIRETIGNNNRKKYIERYTIKRNIEALTDILDPV